VSPAKPRRKLPGSASARRSFAVALAAIALLGLGVLIAATPGRSPGALIGGPFALQTADGKTLTDADMKGRPFLVYFGYTHCPDVCPTTLAQISDALRLMPGKPIRTLFVTVDP
jgi:protein SCO1/2